MNPETDFVAGRFQPGAQVWTRVAGREQALTIVDARVDGRRPILAFEGYATVEASDALAGAETTVQRIGDCVKPRRILEAIREGFESAYAL